MGRSQFSGRLSAKEKIVPNTCYVLALIHKYAAVFSVSTPSVVSTQVLIGFGERVAKDEKRRRKLENSCYIEYTVGRHVGTQIALSR